MKKEKIQNEQRERIKLGAVERIKPFKQTGMAKELGIDISDGRKLF